MPESTGWQSGLGSEASRRRLALARQVGDRIGAALFVTWLAITLTFVALQIVPGDPLKIIVGPGSILSSEALADLRHTFNLDQAIPQRYMLYFWHLLHGDLGLSYRSQEPVTDLIMGQIGSSLALTAAALCLAWVMAVSSIVFTARRSRALESIGRTLESDLRLLA